MPNVRMVVEYNGSGFHGWQVQPNLRTIQGELRAVLETVLRQPVATVTASGRTDAGVHARGQVVNFTVEQTPDCQQLGYSVSSLMRGELAVLDCKIVPDEFDARRDAVSKQYTYTILNRPNPPVLDKGRVLHVVAPLNIERLSSDAQQIVGEYDCKSFQASGCQAATTTRTIESSKIFTEGDYVYYSVVGNGFLKQMIRIIVGTLLDLERGKLSSRTIAEVIDARDREFAGETAAACGLCLDWVKYQ